MPSSSTGTNLISEHFRRGFIGELRSRAAQTTPSQGRRWWCAAREAVASVLSLLIGVIGLFVSLVSQAALAVAVLAALPLLLLLPVVGLAAVVQGACLLLQALGWV